MDIEEFYLHCLLNHGTPYQIDYITFWKVVWEVYDRDDLVPLFGEDRTSQGLA
jgi:hypothetical protein